MLSPFLSFPHDGTGGDWPMLSPALILPHHGAGALPFAGPNGRAVVCEHGQQAKGGIVQLPVVTGPASPNQ